MTTVHLPHPHRPHPLAGLDDHPWRALPMALLVIALMTALLILGSFGIAKIVTGHAY